MTAPSTPRDRDEHGRARNARPRDRLGRPLPHDATGPDVVEGIPEDLDLAPQEYLEYAQRLLDDGLPFHAHEVLEAAWKHSPEDQRMMWQGLAQVAVGVTHIERGNVKGAITLFERAVWRLSLDERPAPYGIDVPGLTAYSTAMIDDLKSGNPIAPQRLHPQLVV